MIQDPLNFDQAHYIIWKNNMAETISRFQIGTAAQDACSGGFERRESCQHLPEDSGEPGKHVYIVRTFWIYTDFWSVVRRVKNKRKF